MDTTLSGTITLQLLKALRPSQEQLGLSPFVTLLAVASSPGISVTDLADAVGVPQSTASRYVSVLLGRYQPSGEAVPIPFIVQEISTEDPRKRALFLSPAGQQLVEKIFSAIKQ